MSRILIRIFVFSLVFLNVYCDIETCDIYDTVKTTQCLVCKDPSLNPVNGKCSCDPLGTAPDGKCCHQTCTECTVSNNENYCTKCPESDFLSISSNGDQIGPCIDVCTGYSYGSFCYTDTCPDSKAQIEKMQNGKLIKYCQVCDISCKECDQFGNCLKCADPSFYVLIDKTNPQKMQKCDHDCINGFTYENKGTKFCYSIF